MIFDGSALRVPDLAFARNGNVSRRLSRQGDGFDGGGCAVRFTLNAARNAMEISLTADGDVSYIIVRFQGKFAEQALFYGDALERLYGDGEWRGAIPERVMPWYFMAAANGATVGFGVKTRPNALCFWQADSDGITLWLDARCGTSPSVFKGETLALAEVTELRSIPGENPFAFHKRFCAAMCSDPVLPNAPVYGMNNWYYAYGNSSHEEILRDGALLAELTQGLKHRPYMVIDDGWQAYSGKYAAAGGPYDRGNEKFPDMRRLAEELKAKDVKPGLWIRPLLRHDANLPDDWFLRGAKGVLDVTVPEARKQIGDEIRGITAGWGYGLVKIDFTTYDILGKYAPQMDFGLFDGERRFRDTTKTTAQAVKLLYQTLSENAAGAVLIGCNCIGHLSAGYFHVHRIGDDTSGHNWERVRRMGVNALAFRLAQHNTFFAVDADCAGVTEQIPWQKNAEWLRLLANSGTTLFCSVSPNCADAEKKAFLRKAFAETARQAGGQSAACEPLDWLYTRCPSKWRLSGETVRFDFLEEGGTAFLEFN
ncbi:MAG: alpha-galactosidase [Clostridiales bacterium]|jgi:alpha-galactosidase|nr:alpha-galactosidase [Clostridiales bacterium]